MLDWLTYSIHDFLLFSPEVYWYLVERHINHFGPVLVFWQVINVAALYLSHVKQTAIYCLLPLTLNWLLLGGVFYLQQYSQINPYAKYLGYLSLLQAITILLLLRSSFDSKSIKKTHLKSVHLKAAAALLILLPIFLAVFQHQWTLATVGVMPLPTIFTSLILLSAMPRKLLLLPLPMLLLTIEALTLITIKGL